MILVHEARAAGLVYTLLHAAIFHAAQIQNSVGLLLKGMLEERKPLVVLCRGMKMVVDFSCPSVIFDMTILRVLCVGDAGQET